MLAVPHAGRCYPPAVLRRSAVPLETLQLLEDRYVDRLIPAAIEEGAVAIVAQPARAWIDLNRAPDDMDQAPPRAAPAPHGNPADGRARIGLGIIPTRLAGQPLWRQPWSALDLAERIAAAHEPYHRAIGDALSSAARMHGRAVLIDCHSMPPLKGGQAAQIVIGNLHGASAGQAVVAAAEGAARSAGFRVAINAPYAGAYSLERHGVAGSNIEAVQIEIDRTLYLRADMRTPGAGIERVVQALARIAAAVRGMNPPALPIAAE